MKIRKKEWKKRYLFIFSMFFLLWGVIGCKKEKLAKEDQWVMKEQIAEEMKEEKEIEETVKEKVKEDLHIGQEINPLTGLWIDEKAAKRRPVAVMINNHKRAWPHHGLAQADVIYETLAEGEMTRLMAIFQDFDAEKIGPIRSARHYYLDFAFDHDAIYVHYGQSIYAHRAFKELNVENLNGLSWLDEIMCWRDMERWKTKGQEHSAFTNAEKIMTAWNKVGYRSERQKDFPLIFHFFEEDTIIEGENANEINLPFSYYLTSEFKYDVGLKKYKHFQSGEVHIDANTQEQLAFKNILIQLTDIWTIPNDPNFCRDMNLLTEGEGFYITNGKVMPVKWNKTSHHSPTQFVDLEGKPLQINKGNTWISIYPKNQRYEIQ
ncbi:MAG: DUF3048 domain-containing protein [Epulopiscium sp.]|nr:DUF3048 domain-containing protein [Candidatus Epulonipiscium sp.]